MIYLVVALDMRRRHSMSGYMSLIYCDTHLIL